MGLGPGECYSVVIDLGHCCSFTIDFEEPTRLGLYVCICLDVFPPENDIIRREIPAIPPLHTFAQVKSVHSRVVRNIPAFGNVWNNLGPID